MGLIWGALIENDISLSEDNIRGQRNFSNKIWNVSRFIFLEPSAKKGGYKNAPKAITTYDKKIVKDLKQTSRKVTRLLDKYRLSEAAAELYNFFWNNFANDYLEKTKSSRKDSQKILEYVLQESLKLLHPFMPFVSETVWQSGNERFDSPYLISANWPKL
jgi:valyl-tRNA synthetase